jgi:SAM-dependent methyltransferase
LEVIVSVEVLQSKAEIRRARERLMERGLSCLGLEFEGRSLWQRLRGDPQTRVGDEVKSWDVLRTAEYVERAYPKSARVLDLGAFSSEILCVLHRAGFQHLTGMDLNPRVTRMPFESDVHWKVGNFLHSSFGDGSFEVITSVSVIEHGFDAPVLLREASRLLSPGGTFLASFDYWPAKIDTSDTRFFGLDWRIFSRSEVEEFVKQAAGYGLVPAGPLALDAAETTVSCAGRDYTFAWLALRRT